MEVDLARNESAMTCLRDRLRLLVPSGLAGRLPDKRSRKHIRTCIAEERWSDLPALVGQDDPFECGALWLAIEEMLTTGDFDGLPALEPLSTLGNSFEQAVFQALLNLTGGAEGRTRAAAQLGEIGDGEDFDPFERMGARAWALYLGLPEHMPGQGASSLPVVQFWDKPQPPTEIAAEMDKWWAMAGQSYQRFNDDSTAEFLRKTHGPAAERRFRAAPHPAIGSDYFRLGFLAAQGGLYLDADYAPREGAGEIMASLLGQTVLVFTLWRGGAQIRNAIVSALPGNSLIVECFDEAGRRLDAGTRPVQHLAGGHMMTDTAIWMVKAGRLGEIASVTGASLDRNFVHGVQTSYKASDLNWRIWQGERS